MTSDTPTDAIDLEAEWLEADGLGGFASGTAGGLRTRRYHALLMAATHPPAGRIVLVNGVEAWLDGPAGPVALSSQCYQPGLVHPDARGTIAAFSALPWPSWTLRPGDGGELAHEVVVDRDAGETLLRWRRVAGEGPCRLHVRPLLSGRDYGALQAENPSARADAAVRGGNVSWRVYGSVPACAALTNGAYRHEPEWYRSFLYTTELDRGLDDTEDLLSPGVFTWDLAEGDAVMVLREGDGLGVRAGPHADRLLEAERARRAPVAPLLRAAGCYVVDRAPGRTILAGFPWFTDWGRDTFIAMRGLLLATGRLRDAEQVLLAWAPLVSEGMLPNRFPDDGGAPEYNSVDASLWFVVAVHDFLAASPEAGAATRGALAAAVEAILHGYASGTRHGIGVDGDGLVRAGAPGQQLTWMDAKMGDWVVTPRRGKPVEIQALWVNALRVGGGARWDALADRAMASFVARFPNNDNGGLFDVVDVDGEAGRVDASIRPNQVFAVGGLPVALLDGAAARRVVDLVEARLLTPMGLRTLAPGEPGYLGRYRGDLRARDGAYHQGTAWPWLTGPFVEAWLRVHGDNAANRAEASRRFLGTLRAHMETTGLGHISEVADGDAPHTPGGCPWQAWSLGEFIRAGRMVGEAPG